VRAFVGGAPPTPALLEEMDELGIDVIHLYGLTESYGPAVICEWHPEWDDLPASERAELTARQGVGNVLGGEVRVVDEDGADVPADGESIGEILLRGNCLMGGYFEDREATAEATTGDGWFRTGDLAVVQQDGYVDIKDRAKDIIVSGGENISSVEVERVLAKHPAVLEAAVVGIPHDKWGERPRAHVVLRDGAAADEAELRDHVRASLAGFKVPDEVMFGELPKTSTGKVQKHVLRDG
jgi:fatty-acyl-CoA synthase